MYEDGTGPLYDGWEGWMLPLESYSGDGSEMIPCPQFALGLGPVPYAGRTWTTDNGPYAAYIQRIDRTFYRRPDLLVVDYVAQDGARAVSDAFSVTCRRISGALPFAYFDVLSFQPLGWRIRYEPGSGGGGCGYTMIIYDPEGCDGTGGGGSTGGGGGGDGGGGSGGNCHTEYIYIEISNDGGNTWTVYWEGYATVCE